jgi:gliding motility-associated-like protein
MVTQNVDSLLAGTYTVTVNDDNGCITTSSVTIPEPPKLEGELYVEKPISCYNGADGVIAIDLVGGSPPYRIDWYSPEFTIYQRTPKITNLHEGLYQIEVIDSNDCYLKDTLYLDSPESPFYTDIETKNPDCSYSADGNLQVTVHNGTSPYSYQWSHGAQSKNVFGLTAGKYDVTVTDNLGCETYNNAILVAPDELEAYTNIKKVSCLQEQDGSIKLIPYGGTPPYEVAWSTGQTGQFIDQLATGFYDATVTDANECLKNITLEMLVKGVGCIDIPSAFTPNGDGMNDKWIIRHLNLYPDHSIKVFTKWGSLIYKAAGNGHERPWDGTYNGNNMPAATYYYIVDLGNNEPLRKGLVTIVR